MTADWWRGRQRRWRTLIAGVCLLALAGCSARTFFYNRLDFIIPWQLGAYVDLERAQSRYLDELLAPFLSWHRTEELPRYAALLHDMEQRLDRPVTAADIASVSRDAEEAWYRLRDGALVWLLDLGAQISDEQIDAFIARLRDKQQTYEEKYLPRSEQEYRDDAFDSLRDNLQDYMGRLEGQQKETLRTAVGRLTRSDAIWLGQRAAWVDLLERLLQREPGWQEAIYDAVTNWSAQVSEEYQAVYAHNSRVVEAAVARVIDSRTAKQDRRLRAELSGLRQDIDLLLAAGEGQ